MIINMYLNFLTIPRPIMKKFMMKTYTRNKMKTTWIMKMKLLNLSNQTREKTIPPCQRVGQLPAMTEHKL